MKKLIDFKVVMTWMLLLGAMNVWASPKLTELSFMSNVPWANASSSFSATASDSYNMFYAAEADGNVAKIGDTEYATFAAALAAVKDGDVIYLLADADASSVAFTPCNGKSVIIAGTTGNETLNMGDGAKGGISGTTKITFLNLKMQIRHTNTSGTWYCQNINHAGKIKYENVVFDGAIATADYVEFLNCTFASIPQEMEYTTWNYGGTQVFKGCTFETAAAGSKSFVKAYAEPAGTLATNLVMVECTFNVPSPTPSGWKGSTIYFSTANTSTSKIYLDEQTLQAGGSINYSSGCENKAEVCSSLEATGFTLPTPTKISNAVAQIGTTTYSSLAEAVAAVPTDGTETTIVMIADEIIEGNAGVTIAATQNVVLDLNGFTVSQVAPDAKASQLISNKGTLKIKDSSTEGTGTLTAEIAQADPNYGYGNYTILNNGKLTIEGGNIYVGRTSGNGGAVYCLDAGAGSDVNITGGYIEGKTNCTAIRQTSFGTAQNDVCISGGTIKSGAAYTIQVRQMSATQNSTFTISGDAHIVNTDETYNLAVYTTVYQGSFENVYLNITGGTFDGDVAAAESMPANRVSVSGGTFNGYYGAYSYGDVAFITGGTFTGEGCASVADYVAEGFELKLNENGTFGIQEAAPAVAKIGNVEYATLAEAVAAAQSNAVVEILAAGEYKIPNLPQNITIKGDVEGVLFDCVGSGSIASVPNGATFENVTMNFGQSSYHGFQHAGKINMNGCTLNGLFFSYGDMNFTECTFNQDSKEYMMWAYGKDLTFKDCKFNGKGKFINVYCESNTEVYNIKATGCTFKSDTKNKAAFNVKETSGVKMLKYNVEITDCTTEGSFPEANEEGALLVISPLVQVDDRNLNATESGIKVTLGEESVYPLAPAVAIAKIGDVEYATLAEAVAAVQDGETITMLTDVDGASGISVASGKNFTIDFDNHVYTLGGNGAGSAGTKTIGFQLLKESTITFKNGTIQCSEANKDRTWTSTDTEKGIAMLIQNYANLTLDNMVIDGTNIAHNGASTRYVLSNNSGEVAITGGTSITASEGDVAFDVCKSGNYDAPTVTVDASTITGIVELTGGKLSVIAGTFTDEIPAENVAEGCIEISLKNANGENLGKYVVGEYPQAFVNKLGEPFKTPNLNEDLNVAYSFNAFRDTDLSIVGKLDASDLENPQQMAEKLTAEELQRAQQVLGMMSPYLKYNADFVVSFDEPVNADAFVLAGQYNNALGEDWLEVSPGMKGLDGSIDKPIRLLENLFTFNYAAICTQVVQFNCGARAIDPVAMAGKTMTVELRLYETNENNSETGNYYTIGSYEYTFSEVVNNVAKIGDEEYATLAEAVAAVQDGETITMLTDVDGASGISVASGKNFTIDFDGHKYTLGGNGAGSAGTKTIGFQLLKESTITFKNGTIQCSEANKDRTWTSTDTEKGIAMLIQNYANLTLDNMVIDGTNIAHNGASTRYVLSNNSGEVAITGGTSITASEGDVAFDVCKSGNYDAPTVTVDASTITGVVELSGGELNITSGQFAGSFKEETGYAEGDVTISGGVFNASPNATYVAEGYQVIENTNEATKTDYPYAIGEIAVPEGMYAYCGTSEKLENVDLAKFLSLRAQNPNTVAFVSASVSGAEDFAEQFNNVVLIYEFTSRTQSFTEYVCPNFVLTEYEKDKYDYVDFYTPVNFTAESGSYVRKDIKGLNSVCLPFYLDTEDLGATYIGLFHSTDMFDEEGNVIKEAGNAYFTHPSNVEGGTPCIVCCPEGVTEWNVDLSGREIVCNDNINNRVALKGVYADTSVGEGYYKINSAGTKYSRTTADSHTVYAFRSYLDFENQGDPTKSSSVKSFNIEFIDDEADAISTIKTDAVREGAYDLMGRKVTSLVKGNVYIINGKKTLVK